MMIEARPRLMRRIIKINDCWMWFGAIHRDGYGVATYQTKQYRVHRLSWKAFRGKLPKHSLVCHTCDIPLCIRPRHLFLGNPGLNAQDALRKGRLLTGSKGGLAKLTWRQVLQIRSDYWSNRKTTKELAIKYRICTASVWNITNFITWNDGMEFLE